MKTFEEKVAEALKQRARQLNLDAPELVCGKYEKEIGGEVMACPMWTVEQLAPAVAAAIDRAIPDYAVRHLDKHRRRALKALKETA